MLVGALRRRFSNALPYVMEVGRTKKRVKRVGQGRYCRPAQCGVSVVRWESSGDLRLGFHRESPATSPVIVEPTSGCIRPVGRILVRHPQPETLELHRAHGLGAGVANQQHLSPFQIPGQVQA